MRHFQQLLSSRADNFQELAQELYDLLVKPAEDQIGLKTKLVIVPDGVLWHLPFEALQASEDHYVVDHAQVSYAPSLSSLREMRKQRLSAGRLNSLLVAYGNPELSKNFKTRFEFAYAGVKLESTAEQEEEIKRIAASYGPTTSRVYAGPQASEERIKSDTSRPRIMHFSNPRYWMTRVRCHPLSGFHLRQINKMGFFRSVKSWIYKALLNWLWRQRRNSSADSQWERRGRIFLGVVCGRVARDVSESLEGRIAKTTLLTGFYSSMKQTGRTRISKARALHQSLLAIRRSADHQHPYYWASFAMIGDAR